jgi:phosphonate transport system substrate-binding protein
MLRVATFLSPLLYETYEYITHYLGERLDCPTHLHVGQSLDEFTNGQTDMAFLCGLPYVHMARRPDCPIEVIAAPVVQGQRYQGRPIYFSDVVVHRDSRYTTFDDLQGCTWAYNERASHSGYNIVQYSLLQQKRTSAYFGSMLETGGHIASMQAVLERKADASAIDSHVLDVLLARNPSIAAQVRIIAMLGPTAIPPLVITKSIDKHRKQRIKDVLYSMHHDAEAARMLQCGLIARLVPIQDEAYDSIRNMYRSQSDP